MEKKLTYDKYDAGQGFLFALFMPFVISLVYIFLVYIVASICGADLENITENTVYVIFATLVSPIAFVLTFVIINKVSRTNYITALGVKRKFDCSLMDIKYGECGIKTKNGAIIEIL